MNKVLLLVSGSQVEYKLDRKTSRYKIKLNVSREELEKFLGRKIKGDSPMPPSNTKLEKLILGLQKSMLGLQESMNKQFDIVNSRLDKVEYRLDKVDDRLDKIDLRLDRIESLPTIKKEINDLNKKK